MKIIKRDNAEINYNVSGKGYTSLLFVHGSHIARTRREWDRSNFAEDAMANPVIAGTNCRNAANERCYQTIIIF